MDSDMATDTDTDTVAPSPSMLRVKNPSMEPITVIPDSTATEGTTDMDTVTVVLWPMMLKDRKATPALS